MFKMIYMNYDSEMQDGKMLSVICKKKLYPEMVNQCIYLNLTTDVYGGPTWKTKIQRYPRTTTTTHITGAFIPKQWFEQLPQHCPIQCDWWEFQIFVTLRMDSIADNLRCEIHNGRVDKNNSPPR